jgi:hypothetical protein
MREIVAAKQHFHSAIAHDRIQLVRGCARRQRDDDRAGLSCGEEEREVLDAVVREDSVAVARLDAGVADRGLREALAGLGRDDRELLRRDPRALR